jgi:hypothetical protein
VAGEAWFFGLLREAGGYRIVAAGPTEGRVRRAMEGQTNPTLIVTQDDLASVGIGEREWRRWLPEALAAQQGPGAPPAPEPPRAPEPQMVQGGQKVQSGYAGRGAPERRG